MSDPPTRSNGSPLADGPVLLDDRYTIVRALGEGGMGRVFEGVHTTLGKPVAIKVLHRHLATDARSRKRLLREARAASTIRHPGVVETIDFGQTHKGAVFLVMELLQGRDLGAVLAETGPLPWPRVLSILRQAASALAEAHEHGIIHRDIKPANCFVLDGPGDRIKLLDFGVAKVDSDTESTGGLTATGEVLGTATYMAPELTLGTPAGVPTDVYALGITAYQLLTGAPPFSGSNPYDVLKLHIEQAPAPLHRSVAGIPAELEAIVLRALAKDPAARFGSMTELEAALAAIAGPEPGEVVTPRREPGGPAAGGAMGPMGTEVIESVRASDPEHDDEQPTMAFDRGAVLGATLLPGPGPGAPAERPASAVPTLVAPAYVPEPAAAAPPPRTSSRTVVLAVVAVVVVVAAGLGLAGWLALR
ncbi:MAG: serine/threonine-protein kinase [Nannocystaceae bacterium]